MDYEMRLPNGVGEQVLAHTVEKFEVKLKHTDYGPVLVGTADELENARDFIVKSINERLNELSNKKDDNETEK
ncbi:MAG: hypothetical protein ISP01_09980 [Methanobrevibacter arboriphilus]|jgi:hypothetical protein|uniref:Uncharacterized protein n=2 Tax=Methanobrevibacter arboriphilus TaxID=39441 RepID=A0A843AJ00_METAZ|nr:hypothetical protein [Methanobrevibacter arboriphilus]MBF4469721.1 hypothetical protein [Methanobrevibacter arboriphilus]MCC7561321.1 hypothetical protein [Methanobrevibacter arboriphilus]BBL61793.1 hypothetical protein MarbSA_08330 [Methanobrevibacter arboriphilus]GLI12857.1 hypothetical protein MARBORIA2_19470 [Methanobrevibacter arboriphilus]